MKPIRRIVTGHNAIGRSCIVEDEAIAQPYLSGGNPKHAFYELWETRGAPASNAEIVPTQRPFRLPPPTGGAIFRIVDLPPDRERDFGKLTEVFKSYGAEDALDQKARHGAFHKTQTLDYAVVLAGEVWALMDEGETRMEVGDVLIQRGTNHAWSNRSDDICRLLFVLMDAPRQEVEQEK